MLIDSNKSKSTINNSTLLSTCSDTSSSKSSLNTNNLNSLIGGSIRILNQTDYSKQLNQSNVHTNTSISMKNINEIANPRPKTHYSVNNTNYNNLELALKAATAALEKSKITASSNFIPDTSFSYSTQNLLSAQPASKQVFISQQKFNPISQAQSQSNLNMSKKSNLTKSSKSPSSSSTTSNTTTSSTQALSGSAASILFNSNQSLFQPYSKLKKSSTPITKKSKLYRHTLVIDTVQTNNSSNSSSSSSSSSASSSSANTNAEKLDTSEYDNIETNDDLNNSLNSVNSLSKNPKPDFQNKKISIQLNGILKRQKSASTEFLNIGKNEIDMEEDSLNNYNHIKDFESKSNSPQPPKIQPYSGVLSKSLFSLVLRPQPVKPVLEQNQQKSNFKSKTLLLKKKCVSTTNLVLDSPLKIATDSSSDCKTESSSKSVTTLNSIKNEDSSDNSINIDEVDCDQEEDESHANDQVIDVIINDTNTNSSNDKRIFDLESQLKLQSNEINELKNRLNSEIEKHKFCSTQRKMDDLEEEKQIYEQKLNSLKAHFNQQLNMFEQNERSQMQEKINNLQKIYNDLKINYKRNLDSELKSLKSKLSESEAYAEQLFKQLQILQSVNSTRSKNSVGVQANLMNERDFNNNNNGEMLYYLKKLKAENTELRIQMESERRRFQSEKEKWYMQFQACMQNKRNSVNVSNENLTNQSLKSTTNNNYTKTQNLFLNQIKQGSQAQTVANNLGKMSSNQNNLSLNSVNSNFPNGNNKTNSTNQSKQQQPFVKNVLLNHQHYL